MTLLPTVSWKELLWIKGTWALLCKVTVGLPDMLVAVGGSPWFWVPPPLYPLTHNKPETAITCLHSPKVMLACWGGHSLVFGQNSIIWSEFSHRVLLKNQNVPPPHNIANVPTTLLGYVATSQHSSPLLESEERCGALLCGLEKLRTSKVGEAPIKREQLSGRGKFEFRTGKWNKKPRGWKMISFLQEYCFVYQVPFPTYHCVKYHHCFQSLQHELCFWGSFGCVRNLVAEVTIATDLSSAVASVFHSLVQHTHSSVPNFFVEGLLLLFDLSYFSQQQFLTVHLRHPALFFSPILYFKR